jgi:hypothetical protein
MLKIVAKEVILLPLRPSLIKLQKLRKRKFVSPRGRVPDGMDAEGRIIWKEAA